MRPDSVEAVSVVGGPETHGAMMSSSIAVSAPVREAIEADTAPDTKPGAAYALKLVAVSVAEAENGREVLVPATDPRGLELSGYFPGRALDPVLHVGDLHFHRYRYTDTGRLMFVVADVGLLKAGAEVYVQYGDNPHSRIDITASLELTP